MAHKFILPIVALIFFVAGFAIFSTQRKSDIPVTQKAENTRSEAPELPPRFSILYQDLSLALSASPQTEAVASSVFDIDNQNIKEVQIGYRPDRWNDFTLSPSGEYLIRWNDYHISVAKSEGIENFKEIVTIEGPYDRISGLSVFPDGKRILYAIVTTAAPSQKSDLSTDRKNSVYSINVDGTEQRLIKTYPTNNPSFLKLRGIHPERQEFYWAESLDGGGERNFTVADLSDGHIKETRTDFPESWYSYAFGLSPALDAAYISTEENFTEYSLITKDQRVLFTYPQTQDRLASSNTFPLGFLVSPLGNKILLFDTIERNELFSLNVADGKTSPFANDSDAKNLIPRHWSPDGKYIWFEGDGKYFLFDTDKNILSPFAVSIHDEGVNLKEKIEFIGWLQDK